MEVEPVESLDRFELIDRGPLRARHVWALVSRLPEAIGHRECDTVCRKLGWSQQDCSVEQVADSPGAGNVVMIRAEFANATELATGFGQRGVPAERVAAGAARQMHRYLAADAPVGPHLADQLMLPLGISAHRGVGGRFRTVGLTEHSRTHLDVLRAFLDIDVQVEQNAADDVLVTMTPASADS